MKYLNIFFVLLFIISCSKDTTRVDTAPSFSSESSLYYYPFENSIEFEKLYQGACDLSLDTTYSKDENSSLKVTNRANSYDGAALNVTNKLEAKKLYIFRGYIKRASLNSDSFKVMLKVGDSTYIELNKVLVDNDEWTKFRAYIYLSDTQVQDSLYLYINSDNFTDDYYLDSVEIATTTYTPPTLSTQNIPNISDNIKLKGINLYAYLDDNESAENFYIYSWCNYDKEDFKEISQIGFNSVRINLWYKLFEDDTQPMVYLDKGFKWLDTVIGWAKENNLYVVLDMHAPQGGSNQGPNNITAFWNDIAYQDRFVALWEEIAKRYRYEPSVVAYDIINEPCPNNELEYQNLLKRTIDAIRTIDTQHILNVERSFASDSQPFVLSGYSNILYDFHFYDPWDSFTNDPTSVYGTSTDNSTLKSLFDAQISLYKQSSLPFHVSEIGQLSQYFNDKNSSAWVDYTIDLINSNNASFHYFTFKGKLFGLYGGENKFAQNSSRNEELYQLLIKKLN